MGNFTFSFAGLPPKPNKTLVYLAKIVAFIPLKLYFRLSVQGVEQLPNRGPALVAANHTSYLDAIILGFLSPAPMHYFSKEEMFRSPFFRWLMRRLGAMPITRGSGGGNAIRKGLKILRARRVLMLFPEGTRSSTGELLEGKAGIGILMKRSLLPVVPVRITGTERALGVGHRFPKPYKIKVRIGNPIFDHGGGHQKVADTVMMTLDSLEDHETKRAKNN